MENNIYEQIASELGVKNEQVKATVTLLDEGSTVPFIARYRKEVTGALDDNQLRTLEERLHYLRELEDRRATVLKSIEEQGKLTSELRNQIISAETKNRLEDLYLPFKPKRRTKGQIAIEAGLEPLADKLFLDPKLNPETTAEAFLNPENNISTPKDALDGAKYILMERFAENADLIEKVRRYLLENAKLTARVIAGKESEGAKFLDYFEHDEPLKSVPSHRALAMLRGRNDGILTLALTIEGFEPPAGHPCESIIAEHFNIRDESRAADAWLREVVRWTWKIKLLTHIETDLIGQMRERSEQQAIEVFAHNLKDLLLAAPAGAKPTIGLDPGLRTGVKVAVIDATGKVVDHGAIFPTPPQNRIVEAEATLVALCKKHHIELIAIGNGTASRETEKFVADMLKAHPDIKAQKVIVNEAGASVYSASEFAAKEFPELDVTIRGAISIARRLQDPLAELVKIDPKSIGVGQYQHDVSQPQLAKSLDTVVEDCVNAVGVEVNTASAPLLARVSGLTQSIANNIVSFRDTNGRFNTRADLKKVPRFGDKTFEQAAGFLRIVDGENPLDRSAVHPESYSVVESIAEQNKKSVTSLIGDSQFLRSIKAEAFVSEKTGLLTVKDIIAELDKPGRDPRPEFKTAQFQDGVEKISDLEPGMILEGAITNVTAFGAFVDIGVHQDGLVHISALSNTFVKDPREVVKAGDIVKVKVMEVDVPRKRIGLSMRLSDEPGEKITAQGQSKPKQKANRQKFEKAEVKSNGVGSMGALLAQAMKKK
ncbi:Tex family protein [Sessilibacter sp. MAH4]